MSHPERLDSAPAAATASRGVGCERPDVVVLIVAYNGSGVLPACLESLAASESAESMAVIVVDNASRDGTPELVAERFAWVTLIRSTENRGYAGGCNLAFAAARERFPEAAFIAVLNQDTVVDRHWLAPLRAELDREPKAALVQPLILLLDEPERINTAGNRSHFLGFGYMLKYRQTWQGMDGRPFAVDFPSGAAFLARANVLAEEGLFDEQYFMYLEDCELGWRLKLRGYSCLCVPESRVFHQYTPSAPFKSYEHLERNRYRLLLTFYKVPTLLLLAPALLMMEVGQWVFAARHGLIGARRRMWHTLLRRETRGQLRTRRRWLQAARRLTDLELLGNSSGMVRFEVLDSPLLRYVGNPILAAYWAVARRLLWW